MLMASRRLKSDRFFTDDFGASLHGVRPRLHQEELDAVAADQALARPCACAEGREERLSSLARGRVTDQVSLSFPLQRRYPRRRPSRTDHRRCRRAREGSDRVGLAAQGASGISVVLVGCPYRSEFSPLATLRVERFTRFLHGPAECCATRARSGSAVTE